jgi:hypothetical protein
MQECLDERDDRESGMTTAAYQWWGGNSAD